ncbi:MAG: hypothetical protein MJ162_00820 [Treponema sp.]|nr:hypothetical protein [Treponema sp.]
MKKLLITLTILISSLFAANAQLLNFSANFQTGIPIYSSPSKSVRKTLLASNNTHRIAAGGDFNVQFNITEPVKTVGGFCSFSDFIFDSNSHYNSIDYSVYAGIRVYPNLYGFNFMIAHVLGGRSDFIKTDELSTNTYTKWGNGFILDLNYDFLLDSKYSVMPSVGICYRFMPRGNYSYDHIITAYAGIKF